MLNIPLTPCCRAPPDFSRFATIRYSPVIDIDTTRLMHTPFIDMNSASFVMFCYAPPPIAPPSVATKALMPLLRLLLLMRSLQERASPPHGAEIHARHTEALHVESAICQYFLSLFSALYARCRREAALHILRRDVRGMISASEPRLRRARVSSRVRRYTPPAASSPFRLIGHELER